MIQISEESVANQQNNNDALEDNETIRHPNNSQVITRRSSRTSRLPERFTYYQPGIPL